MSVRKRTWTTKSGEAREAWIVNYSDAAGVRRIATCDSKREADAYEATVKTQVRAGVHTAPSMSPTVAEAAQNWLTYTELKGRERSTLTQYRQHVDLHIVPRLGREKLAVLTTPRINAFCDDLLAGLSRALAKKVLTSIKSILKEAQRRGDVSQNVARDVSIDGDKRGKRKLKVGADIPTPQEIGCILCAAAGKWRPILVAAIFTGLRSSELRGLCWADIDLKRGVLHVRQRADRYNAIGSPKSEKGERSIPLGPFVLNALREWKLACPPSALGLVFPTSRGRIVRHENIIRYAWGPTQIAAGVVNASGECKYPGLHAVRHFYASWSINRRADGGLELPLKMVQERLGHASIVITTDTYGHLFPEGDDGAELAAAERLLTGLHTT